MIERRRGLWKWIAVSVAISSLLVAGGAFSLAPPEDWHVTADVAESCSCAVACPCNFGSSPTHHYCHGNRLYQITKGHYGETDVSGLEFLVTFSMNEWAKLYVGDEVTDAQLEALKGLSPHILGGFERWGILSTEKAPIVVERSEGKLKFSGPESAVDMDVMKGFDGKPVTIDNLPSPTFQEYNQYKSVVTRHQGGDKNFSYSGTTGFTSKLDVGSEK